MTSYPESLRFGRRRPHVDNIVFNEQFRMLDHGKKFGFVPLKDTEIDIYNYDMYISYTNVSMIYSFHDDLLC